MKVDFNIDIHHLTRVEGHGDIRISVKDGRLTEATWAVVETPRFFEVMVRGMSAERVPFLTSRICGICSTSHFLASVRALERAMEITPPEAARKLRLLAMHGETLQSHCLHIFFLAAPDFLDQPSALPLLQSHPGIVRVGLQLKELGNTISEAITGRATHPVSMVIGGMSRAPGKDQLLSLKTMLQERVESLEVAQSFFLTLAIPDFVRPTEFISLRNPSTYPSIGGDIISSDGLLLNENDYLRATNEYKPDFSTSKFTKASRESSVAGALARVNNNYDRLHPKSRAFAEAFGLKPLCHNPFMNTIAQLVECHHILLDAARLVDELLDMELSEIKTTYRPKAGAATGAVEAPRGILYHHMETDEKGKVVRADCIIPTTQNNANIHYDLHALVSQTLGEGKSERETEKLCVMLVRSYDPCISCSVH